MIDTESKIVSVISTHLFSLGWVFIGKQPREYNRVWATVKKRVLGCVLTSHLRSRLSSLYSRNTVNIWQKVYKSGPNLSELVQIHTIQRKCVHWFEIIDSKDMSKLYPFIKESILFNDSQFLHTKHKDSKTQMDLWKLSQIKYKNLISHA